jgi:hypothetical protein
MTMSLHRRTVVHAALLGASALALGGCAATTPPPHKMSPSSEWPADRKPGSYAFERLPSQQGRGAEMDTLEAAARAALEKAGFKPAAAGTEPEVLVQVGSRVGRADTGPWADPIWWRGSFGYWRHGPWLGPRWGLGFQFDATRYDREVALLMRDRASGKPLFEARASHEGSSPYAGNDTLAAMFRAALMDFPKTGVNPRRVSVQL